MDVPEISSGETRAIRSRRPKAVSSYFLLLALQSAAALALVTYIHRAFRILIDDIGVLHSIRLGELVFFIAAIIVSQAGFWFRLKRVAIPGWRNIVLGHILGFSSRISFIFGGALFSLFFLRTRPSSVGARMDGVWSGAVRSY